MTTIHVTAPTRADLAGGTLDLWPVYCLLGPSHTVNVALDLRAEVQIEIMPSVVFGFELASTSASQKFEGIPTETEVQGAHPSLKFLLHMFTHFLKQLPNGEPERFYKIKFSTQAPAQSGLGGSSSLGIAFTQALWKAFEFAPSPQWQKDIVRWTMDAEAGHIGTLTGTQDYLAAVYGGLATYISDVGGWKRETYDSAVFKELSDRTLVIYSGQTHSSGQSNWEVLKKFLEGDAQVQRGFRSIQEIAASVNEGLKAPQRNWKEIGKLISHEWESRRDLFKVTTPRLDEIISALKRKEILGVKVCGAAQGGSLLILVDPQNKQGISKFCETSGFEVLATAPTSQGVSSKS